MGRATHYAMALSAALALGACADGAGDLSTAPSSPALQVASHDGIVLACSPSDVQKYARNLFGGSSPVLNQAKLITTKNANTDPALNAGYNVMASVADLRAGTALGAWTSAQQTNATELTIRLIGCMDVQLSDPAITLAGLRTALMDALDPDDSGAYAVPDGGSVVSARNLTANLSMTGSAVPPGTFSAWLPGSRVLLLGRGVATFATEISGGVAYDWMTVRKFGASSYVGEGLVGLCRSSSAALNQLRVEHLHGTHTILPFYTATGLLCPDPIGTLGFPAARTFAGRMAQNLFALVQPKPLFASAAAVTGPGGGVRLLSPFEVIEPVAVKVSFAEPPADVAVNVPIVDTLGNPIKVTVTGNLNTPWQGVDVMLSGMANNGETLALACSTGTTDSNGEVTFPALSVNKPGGLRLVATVDPTQDLDGTAYAGSNISDRFIAGPGTATAPACP